jgi:hypothetical protein
MITLTKEIFLHEETGIEVVMNHKTGKITLTPKLNNQITEGFIFKGSTVKTIEKIGNALLIIAEFSKSHFNYK